MFHSIRWRLVASFVVLTLLTVAIIGVVGLSLLKRQTEQRERAYLTANAAAIARQAYPLMESAYGTEGLQELVHTAAFLSDSRVRVLDAQEQVVADSGPRTQVEELLWIAPPVHWWSDTAQDPDMLGPVIIALPPNRPWAKVRPELEQLLVQELPPGTNYIVVQRVMDAWGSRVTFRTGQVAAGVDRPPAEPDSATMPEEPAQRESARSDEVVLQPIGDPAAPVGFVEISGGLGLSAESLASTRRAFLLAGLGATLMAIFFGLLVSRSLAAPIGQLTAAAGHMSAGDLSVRAPVTGQDEIGQLAAQFNQMAERLEASFADLASERDALRRFIADASHELRTPITALKNFNELLQGAAADDPEARAEFLSESGVQIDRLEWITENLLNLSRLDAGLANLHMAPHDLGDVVEAAAAPFRARAREQGVTLTVETPEEPVEIRCDRMRLEMALSNLLDNALKFTPADGRVVLRADATGTGVRISVQDSGPGIAPEDLPHIFERFYRGRNGGASGSGLGLAIVQSIVQAHGGQVAVVSQEGEGTQVTIQMPQ